MKKLKDVAAILFILVIGFSMNGCYKDVITPTLLQSGPPPQVSFNSQILPILTTSCAKSGCHVPGSQVPFMDSTEAYKDLINGGFVNTIVPSESIIYQELDGGPMQVNIPSQADINLIYYWIENGAANN